MSLFSEFLSSSGATSRFDDPDIAWAESIELSIRGMRDAARWMLGVVAGWFILVPELVALRQILPVERPIETVYIAAFLLLLSIWRILTTVLEVQAPSDKTTYDLANLEPQDLEYVQDWGVMAHPSDPVEWQFRKGFAAFVWQAIRHMGPEEAQAWASSFPREDNSGDDNDEAPLPTKAEIMQFGEQLYWMRMEEVRAVLLLSQRDMTRRFNTAKQSMLFFGLSATFSMIVLIGPVSP